MGLKDFAVDALSLLPVARGFTLGESRRWITETARHRTQNCGYSRAETEWAIRHGFMPEQVDNLNITKENVDDFISAKEYAYARPLNIGCAKWLTDIVTLTTMFKPFVKYLPELYYEIGKRFAESFIIPMSPSAGGREKEDLARLVREKGRVTLGLSSMDMASCLTYLGDDRYELDGKEYTEKELTDKLMGYMATLCLWERVEPDPITEGGILNLIVVNEYGDNPRISDAYMIFDEFEKVKFKSVSRKMRSDNLEEPDTKATRFREKKEEQVDSKTGEWRGRILPHWEEIENFVDSFCRFAPELEFFCCQIILREKDFKIIRFLNNPDYPTFKPFSKETSDYLKKKVAQKRKAYKSFSMRRERAGRAVLRRFRKTFARLCYPADLVPYQSTRWIHDVCRDFFVNKSMSVGDKLKAYKRGFLSYRIEQYGITDENIGEYISDFDRETAKYLKGE